jgi:hypothetical protein
MALVLNASRTNTARWQTQMQFSDAETGELIDFTGASILIVVKDEAGNTKIEASTDNGKVSIVSTGVIEFDASLSDMGGLTPGSYPIGGVFWFGSDDPDQLFVGTLTVIDGVASL